MKPNEKAELFSLLGDVHAYYRQDVSEFTLELWWGACKRFDLEQVREALTAHAMDPERGQFAPKVADVVRVLAGTTTDRAALAWGKAMDAMRQVGAYRDVVFDDPAIHAVVEDMGGWPKLCRTELKELGFRQHEFCEAHRAYTGRGKFAYPTQLQGDRDPDHEYTRRGLSAPVPVLVGSPAVCAQVQAGGAVGGKTAISFNVAALLPAQLRNGGGE
jgi:hypothetical protein